MDQCLSHSFNGALRRCPLARQIEDACDAAHIVLPLYRFQTCCQADVLSKILIFPRGPSLRKTGPDIQKD